MKMLESAYTLLYATIDVYCIKMLEHPCKTHASNIFKLVSVYASSKSLEKIILTKYIISFDREQYNKYQAMNLHVSNSLIVQ